MLTQTLVIGMIHQTVDKQKAFTLIELLIVLFIMTLIIGMIIVRLDPTRGTQHQLTATANQFSRLMHFAKEQSIITGKSIGVMILRQEIQFMQLKTIDGEGIWETMHQVKILRPRKLPFDIHLNLREPIKSPPQILLYASGEITPFTLEVRAVGVSNYYTVVGNENGDMTVEEIKP